MSGKNTISRRRFMALSGAGASPLIMAAPKALPARKTVPVSVRIGKEAAHPLPRTQYGCFIEHVGKAIKGGIWAEGEEPDMFMGGVRRELLSAIRSINPALIRYPGGCFADGYHWKDGIGPRSERPVRINRAWAKLGPRIGPLEDNHFGTDEFLELCEATGAEPMITVNVGSGTPQEAAEWVEYVNGSASTGWGAERAKNGHPAPYGVKYWFVGNEIFGVHEIGHRSPAEYVKTFREFARAMRRADPGVKLIPVGDHFPLGTGDPDINRTVLEGTGEDADLLSIHQYVPRMSFANSLRYSAGNLHQTGRESVYYDVMGTLRHMEEFVNKCIRETRTYSPGRTVPLALDEWNLWFDYLEDLVQANYTLRDGVWTASMLNFLHRNAPVVPVANITQMVNCLGVIVSDKHGTFLTPSALVYRLYTENAGEELLHARADSPVLPHHSQLPALDVSATRSGDTLSLFLVNRHYSEPAGVKLVPEGLKLKSAGELRLIRHREPVAKNSVPNPENVKIENKKVELASLKHPSPFSFNLPPHSVACLSVKTEE
ncbi:MAG: alpha-L-arabinofuranosidase C-terminal domain-containing protein [bacterium]